MAHGIAQLDDVVEEELWPYLFDDPFLDGWVALAAETVTPVDRHIEVVLHIRHQPPPDQDRHVRTTASSAYVQRSLLGHAGQDLKVAYQAHRLPVANLAVDDGEALLQLVLPGKWGGAQGGLRGADGYRDSKNLCSCIGGS